jgi:hypothetical protein
MSIVLMSLNADGVPKGGRTMYSVYNTPRTVGIGADVRFAAYTKQY